MNELVQDAGYIAELLREVTEGGVVVLVSAKFIRLATLIAVVVAISSGLAVSSFSDAYAIEVVLNKPGVSYDLSRLIGAERVSYAGGESYVYRSRYDPRILVILSVQDLLDGRYLIVRVQAPFELEVQEVETVYECELPPVHGCYSGELKENVPLDVQPGEGEVTLDLGTIKFRATSFVRFKPDLSVPKNAVNLTVSGLLVLEPLLPENRDTAREYRVMMPCLLSINEPCFRVMVLIPGYDAPLRVEEGVYRVRLTLSWSSNAQVRLTLKQLLVFCDREVLVQPLENLGWTIEEGSAVKRVGQATVTINLDKWRCEVTVPGEAEMPREAKLELAKLLESIGLKDAPLSFSRTMRGVVTTTSDVDESTVKSALRAELEQLLKDGVVKGLSVEDVESIVEESALGRAGPRKLVWYAGGWIPYDQVPSAQPSEQAPSFPWFGPERLPMRAASEQQQERVGRAPGLLPLAVAGAIALAAAAVAFALVKRVFKP